MKLPVILVENGSIIEENLRLMKLSKEGLMRILESLGVKDMSEIFIAYLDSERRAQVIRKPAGTR